MNQPCRPALVAATALLALLIPSAPASGETLKLTRDQASSFARLALAGIKKEFPNKPADVLNSDKDVQRPRTVHPAFYGCFDWHSAGHSHCMLCRLPTSF